MKLTKLISKVLILILIFSVLPFAQENMTGLEIMQKVYNRPTGEDQTAKLTMTLIDSKGNKRVREIKQFSRDFEDMEKKIMFFISPADVRNTAFMNWSYDEADKDDDQWIYLPALSKVKRISSDSKSDYFMGSDFTYDDLGERHPKEDTHELLREETYQGEDCYVVESTPKQEDYMYSRTITWVVKDKWIALKKKFFDEDGEHLKNLTVEEYQNIKDYRIITNSIMHNVQKDHKTDMTLENVELDTGIPERKFTERMMKRGL